MKIELQISLDKEDKFCYDSESLLKLIEIHKDIKIAGNKIEYSAKKEKLVVVYELNQAFLSSHLETYFDLKLTLQGNANIDAFSSLANIILENIKKANNAKVNIIWNDVEKYYAKKAYPIIYETENLMRNLISRFMLKNLGRNWFKNSIPTDLKENIKNRDNNHYKNELHQTDFIDLTKDVLFKKYRDIELNDLDKILAKIDDVKQIDKSVLQSIKRILPKSNWDRYFSKIIDEDEKKLKKQWEQLYKIRNQVAHNVGLTKNKFQELSKITDTLNPKLEQAIQKINTVFVAEGELTSIQAFFKARLQNWVDNPSEVSPEEKAILTTIIMLSLLFGLSK